MYTFEFYIQDLCERHEKGVLHDHQKAIHKMGQYKKKKMSATVQSAEVNMCKNQFTLASSRQDFEVCPLTIWLLNLTDVPNFSLSSVWDSNPGFGNFHNAEAITQVQCAFVSESRKLYKHAEIYIRAKSHNKHCGKEIWGRFAFLYTFYHIWYDKHNPSAKKWSLQNMIIKLVYLWRIFLKLILQFTFQLGLFI